jgi:hypothetical protein
MPNTFHLTLLAIFVAAFSGMPAPVREPTPPVNVTPVAISLPGHSIEENEEYIPWQEERLLTWEDFQGTNKRSGDAVASTSTSLGVSYQIENGELVYQITCNFSKIKSWGYLKTPYILAHEQAHFDITEIAARKMHEALLNYQFNRKTYQKDINQIYQQIVAFKEGLQHVYDKQTDHSRNKRVQVEWLDRIDTLLVETESFAAYP